MCYDGRNGEEVTWLGAKVTEGFALFVAVDFASWSGRRGSNPHPLLGRQVH